jgi:hypothetical protein
MKKLLILFFLASCVAPSTDVNTSSAILDSNDDLNFAEFNKLLIEYAKTSPYPNINK